MSDDSSSNRAKVYSQRHYLHNKVPAAFPILVCTKVVLHLHAANVIGAQREKKKETGRGG